MRKFSALQYRAKRAFERYGLAWRYATQRLTRDDGISLLYDAERAAGIFGLESISTGDVLEHARERWGDVPELADYADAATRRVWSKWSGNGEITGAAEDWAMDLIAEYAAEDNVTLSELAEA